MANTCLSTYYLFGKEPDIELIMELMRSVEAKGKVDDWDYDFALTDLYRLLEARRGASSRAEERPDCRGGWSELERIAPGILCFQTATPFGPDSFVDYLLRPFPEVAFVYQSLAPEEGIFVTNDVEGHFFPERYLLDAITPEGEEVYEFFNTEAALFARLSELAGEPIRSGEDVERLAEEWGEGTLNVCPCRL